MNDITTLFDMIITENKKNI